MQSAFRKTRLLRAVRRGDESKVEELLQAGADPESSSRHGETALMMAAAGGHDGIIRAIVTAGADINRKSNLRGLSGATALMAACADSTGSLATVRTLLELGADLNSRDDLGRTAFDYAVLWPHPEIGRHLLSLGGLPGKGQVVVPE